jgi:hypothetical protein
MTIDEHIAKAHALIDDLCNGRREWIMSVPARPDYDPDLVIAAALTKAEEELAALRKELQKEEEYRIDLTQIVGQLENNHIELIKKVYRKHCLNDNGIGWDELGENLVDALCNLMGEEKFVDWLKMEKEK